MKTLESKTYLWVSKKFKMKKSIAVLSFICFVVVNVAMAQTPQTNTTNNETKKEVVKSEEKNGMSCCKKASKSCCKSSASKNCTHEQKAACAKDGAKAEDTKKETKGGTN